MQSDWKTLVESVGLLFVALCTLTPLFVYFLRRSRPVVARTLTEQTEWVATGRIDFYPETNGRYVLQAEDSRDVTSIGGLQRKEIRWRVASLDEAKKVVVKFHQEASN